MIASVWLVGLAQDMLAALEGALPDQQSCRHSDTHQACSWNNMACSDGCGGLQKGVCIALAGVCVGPGGVCIKWHHTHQTLLLLLLRQ